MKKSLAAFFSGLAVSVFAAYASPWIRRRWLEQGLGPVDLNLCSTEDLRGLGLEDDTIERIVESRPYRSKLELVSRVMLPSDVYVAIKNHVNVVSPDEPVKIAS
jgi:hypothetical protein